MPSKDDKPLSAADMLGEDPPTNLEAAIAAEEAAEEFEPGIDPNHPILTVQEQREAMAKGRARVTAEDRKAAMKAFEDQAVEMIRGKKGLTTGDPVKDELVSISLDLAEHSNAIVLNGNAYWHGQTYEVPRHVADTIREIQSRGWNHQLELDGKGLSERYRAPHNTVFNAKTGAVKNAPQRVAV